MSHQREESRLRRRQFLGAMTTGLAASVATGKAISAKEESRPPRLDSDGHAEGSARQGNSGNRGRLNRLVELLEEKRLPLGIFASNITYREGAALASASIDFVIVDMEHASFDMNVLAQFLLGMTDKRQILAKGNLQPDVVPLVRVPANGREHVQFMFKQVLDQGVFGVVAPHIDSGEEALATVRAMRYPQAAGAPHPKPRGQRGVGYGWAARYWGLSGSEYVARADLWPLDPAGEMILICMVESRDGVENCRAIASTPGVGAVLVGPDDLAFSLGVPAGHPEHEAAIQKILADCKRVGRPCGMVTGAEGVIRRREQGFSFLAVGGDTGLPAAAERAVKIGRK